MASRWTSPRFWSFGGGGGQREEEDGRRREKANSPARKRDRPKSAERFSSEAAFEETDAEHRDHSARLAVVPYENDSPFEAFLAAVFSTLLAFLLAWRFLAWNPENGGERGEVSSAERRRHDDSGDERESRRRLTSSPDSSDSSSGHWLWFRSKRDTSASSSSSPRPESSANANTRKRRKKRRPFDERLAPKRRVNPAESKDDDQLSPSLSELEGASKIRPVLVHSLPPPSPVELEQQSPYSNSSSWRNRTHNNVVVEWPTTAAEDAAPDFVSRTISTPTMEPNFRRLHPQWVRNSEAEDEHGPDGSTVRMILGAHSAVTTRTSDNSDCLGGVVSEKPATSASPKTASGGSSLRRPLVSPPPPPRDAPVSLVASPGFRSYVDMADEENVNFGPSSIHYRPEDEEEEVVEDFLGSDLPTGFATAVPDEIAESVNLLLEELAEADSLLSSRQAPDIVRDLDTITEVSETDDLTSLSSNGGAHFRENDAKSKPGDSERWSRSSTAPCTASQKNDSECYRLAPTVTACSSSSETVNDDAGDEVYVDGDPFLSTPTPSFHDAQTGFPLARCEAKIDDVSRSSVIKAGRKPEEGNETEEREVGEEEGKRTPCLPEENVNQPQFERLPTVAWDTTITTTATEDAFVTAPVAVDAAAQASTLAPLSPNDPRHGSGLAVLLAETGLNAPETGSNEVFREGIGNRLCESCINEKRQVGENAAPDNFGLDLESSSTPSSSGRTSIATDLPIDEAPLLEAAEAVLITSPRGPDGDQKTSPNPEEDAVPKLLASFDANGQSSPAASQRIERKGVQRFSISAADAKGASGDRTSSANLNLNISKTKEDGAEVTSSGEEGGGKNNSTAADGWKPCLDSDQRLVALVDDRSSSCSLSGPRRERRFQLAYQQYHSRERGDEDESEFSHISSSCSSSEPTKTTLLKHESLPGDTKVSGRSEDIEAADEDDSTVPSSCMDQIDLEKALQRFARYGELYGDAPRSGMDEFRGNRNDEDSLDMSCLDSRVNSLPNGGAVGKMEALLKSTLKTRGSTALNGVANGGLSSSTTKRDRVGDDLLSSNVGDGAAGAVHALASTRSNVNGDYTNTTTGTAKTMTGGRKEYQLNEGNDHGNYSVTGAGTRYGRATGAGGDESNKTKATATSALLSYDEKGQVDVGEFLPPARPRRLSVERGLHDKNRYSSQPSALLITTNGASATSAAAAKSNEDGICLTKFKSNPTPQNTTTAGRGREVADKRGRPTSAPLTPLLISSPTSQSASFGFGAGFSSAYEQGSEPVCVASATSQAIINDPDSSSSQSAFFSSKNQRKILAEASANAVASNPYIALARAATAAASKVAEASTENLLDAGEAGTVSLVVSSTVTTTKRDFFSTTKSSPDLLFFSSAADVYDVSDLEVRNRPEMSYHQQRPVEVTPTYGVIPRGTASIFQQRHREMSPNRGGGVRSPERKRHHYGEESSGADSAFSRGTRMRSSATTPVREPKESKKSLFASSEHLQKLLEDPYYAKPPPKPEPPRRSPLKHDYRVPAVASYPSPEKSVPLSERNVSDWNSRPENSVQSQKQKNLLRWRNSMNLAENEELRQAMLEDEKRARELVALAAARAKHDESMESSSYQGMDSKRSSSIRATTPVVPELWDYKIFREAQQRAESEVDEDTKRSRRNKYKAKIERAKRDYLTTKASASDLYRSIEDFEKKFNVSMDNVRLPDPPRGPYLEYLSRSGHLHILDINDLPAPAYVRPKPRFDREYESIVKKAEESWAAYKKRLHAAAAKHGQDLYARSRAYSTGVLETDVDDHSPYQRGQKSIVETDLDQVQREIEHESRKRTNATDRTVHNRAKSADYLMDQRARTEIEPPENQLQKILGDKDEKDLSEHELRFRKSTEKLPVPDWYLNSDYCPGGKVPSPDSTRPRPSAYPTERPKSTQSHYSYGRTVMDTTTSSFAKSFTPSAPKRQDDLSSRYTSPWVYGGRISGPHGTKAAESTLKQTGSPRSQRSATGKPYDSPRPIAKPAEILKQQPRPLRPEPKKATEQPKSQYESATAYSFSKMVTQTTETIPSKQGHQKQDFNLPKHFFDRYKDEIEEMRKSRTALNNFNIQDIDDEATWEEQQLKRLSGQGVPVATVRPNQVRDDDYDTSASISFSPASSSPESRPTSRPHQKYARPTPQSTTQSHHASKPSPAPRTTAASIGSYRDAPLNTSTPYSSDLLSRKQQFSKETAFESYHHHTTQEQPPPHPAPHPLHQIGSRRSYQDRQPMHMPGGWTVSAVPADWNVPGQRDSVVIEVAGDGLFEPGTGAGGNKGRRLPSHLTLDEILDSMLALPTGGKSALTTINESSSSLLDDTQVLPARPRTPTNLEGPGIYTQNQELMDKCLLEPELATELLKRETLWVKCGYCTRVREMEDARRRGFVSCHHCYTYYCNRICRRAAFDRHLDICSFARINTLCKQVILKVRQDNESQFQMSRVAQRGYHTRGRGSVNFRFITVNLAKQYVRDQEGGWKALRVPPRDAADFLHYYTVSDLVDAQKDPSLINLCRRYDPRSRFVLSVSIIADIEECPETPPPELEAEMEANYRPNQPSSWYQRGVGGVPYASPSSRPPPLTDTELSWMTESRKPYQSNGVTKDDIYSYQPQSQHFSRGDQHRHTVAAPQHPRHTSRDSSSYWSSPSHQTGRPALLIGPEDADETEV